jgi:hypothetical protein
MGKSESTPKEEAWIAKYRAALDQTPVSKSRMGKLREAAKRCGMVLGMSFGRIVGWISGNRRAAIPNTIGRKKIGSTPAQGVRRDGPRLQDRPKKSGRRKVG